jgi:hypothetical protein
MSASSTSSPSSRKGIQYRFLGQAAEQQPGGVGLGVAADDHDLLAHLHQAGDGVLGCGGLADAAFAVNCYFNKIERSVTGTARRSVLTNL